MVSIKYIANHTYMVNNRQPKVSSSEHILNNSWESSAIQPPIPISYKPTP